MTNEATHIPPSALARAIQTLLSTEEMADRVVDHDVVVERVLTEALDADPDTAEPSYTIPAISTRSLRDAGYFRGEDGVEVRIGEQVFVVTVESK